MRRLDFETLIPAVVLPMTAEFEIDEPELRRYLGWVRSQGIRMVAVNADTGEGPHLSRQERRRVVEIAAEVFAGGDVISGLYGNSTREAVAGARDAEEAGAAGLLMFPMAAFRERLGNERVVLEYHRAVAEAVDLPMVLFHLQPALGGAEYSPELIARLVELPNAQALKEASFDVRTFTEGVALLRGLPKKITLLTGNDNFIMQSFLLGARGALLGFGTIAVREQLKMLRAVKEQNYREAWRLHEIVQPLERAGLLVARRVSRRSGRASRRPS
jgi:4-hydroxy-tetrahydrodipicolinate synthase